jgi:hypothetical protein
MHRPPPLLADPKRFKSVQHFRSGDPSFFKRVFSDQKALPRMFPIHPVGNPFADPVKLDAHADFIAAGGHGIVGFVHMIAFQKLQLKGNGQSVFGLSGSETAEKLIAFDHCPCCQKRGYY